MPENEYKLNLVCSWKQSAQQQSDNGGVREVLEFLAVVTQDNTLSVPEVRVCLIL